MSDQPPKSSRIRRVPASEKKGRAWPDQSQHASSYPGMLNPDPRKKDKIHSVLTALPFIMLLIGLIFWYRQESAQQSGAHVVAESVGFVGEFNGVSTARSAGGEQFFIWLMQDGNPKTLRITSEQYIEYEKQSVGDAVAITAAPTVSGSSTLWVVDIKPQ